MEQVHFPPFGGWTGFKIQVYNQALLFPGKRQRRQLDTECATTKTKPLWWNSFPQVKDPGSWETFSWRLIDNISVGYQLVSVNRKSCVNCGHGQSDSWILTLYSYKSSRSSPAVKWIQEKCGLHGSQSEEQKWAEDMAQQRAFDEQAWGPKFGSPAPKKNQVVWPELKGSKTTRLRQKDHWGLLDSQLN